MNVVVVGIVLLGTVLLCRRVTGLLRAELEGDFGDDDPFLDDGDSTFGFSGFFSDSLLESEEEPVVDVLLLVPVPEAIGVGLKAKQDELIHIISLPADMALTLKIVRS